MLSKVEGYLKISKEMNFKTLLSWFPTKSIDEILEELRSSNFIDIRGNEEKILYKEVKSINSDLSHDELIELIDKFNRKQEEKLEEIKSNEEDENPYISAVIKYIKDKYIISNKENFNGINIYSLNNKVRKNLIGYALIVDTIDTNLIDLLESKFEYENIHIYCIQGCDLDINTINLKNDLHIEDCKDILSKYFVSYELREDSVLIYKVIEKKGVEVNGI